MSATARAFDADFSARRSTPTTSSASPASRTIWSAGVPVSVLVDGQHVAELGPSESLAIEVGSEKARLALLPEVTFFSRYRETFLETPGA